MFCDRKGRRFDKYLRPFKILFRDIFLYYCHLQNLKSTFVKLILSLHNIILLNINMVKSDKIYYRTSVSSFCLEQTFDNRLETLFSKVKLQSTLTGTKFVEPVLIIVPRVEVVTVFLFCLLAFSIEYQ